MRSIPHTESIAYSEGASYRKNLSKFIMPRYPAASALVPSQPETVLMATIVVAPKGSWNQRFALTGKRRDHLGARVYNINKRKRSCVTHSFKTSDDSTYKPTSQIFCMGKINIQHLSINSGDTISTSWFDSTHCIPLLSCAALQARIAAAWANLRGKFGGACEFNPEPNGKSKHS